MTWRWPWVSRALYDAEVSRREADNAEWSRAAEWDTQRHLESLRAWRASFDDLLGKYQALKLAGAVVVEPPLPAPVVAIAQPDRIKQTIRRQVRANPDMRGLESHLIKYAAELRAQNLPDDKIVDRLSDWESSETMSAPVAIEGAEDAA